MLDEKDLQAIATMMDAKLKEQSETLRMDFMSYIEAHIDPQLKTLAEAHTAIIEKLVPVSRIEALEADNFAMKTAIANLNARLSALEKAQ